MVRARAALTAALTAALRAGLRAFLFILAIFTLAGAPLAIATDGGRPRFSPERLAEAVMK
jgi:hypothetical protein